MPSRDATTTPDAFHVESRKLHDGRTVRVVVPTGAPWRHSGTPQEWAASYDGYERRGGMY